MEQLGGTARGARRQVALLDQADPQAAGRGIERHATTGDATADDQDVERFGGEAMQGVGSGPGVDLHPCFELHAVGLSVRRQATARAERRGIGSASLRDADRFVHQRHGDRHGERLVVG